MIGNQKFKYVAMVVLMAVAVGLTVFRLMPSPAGAEAIDPREGVGVADDFIPRRFVAAEVTWPVELHRDIFRWKHTRVVEPAAPPPINVDAVRRQAQATLQVNAIVIRGRGSALVNGTVCQAGDLIDGYRVVRVEPRGVWFAKDGVEVEIELGTKAAR